MPSPFELDCQRKRDGSLELNDRRKRLSTCVCGIVRQYHWEEVESGRCRRFRPMNMREWAEWIGVEMKD